MEGNNDIFLAGDDALGYLTDQCVKNVQLHLLGVIHLVHADLMTDFSILPTSCPSLCAYVPIQSTPSFCVCDLIDLILSLPF